MTPSNRHTLRATGRGSHKRAQRGQLLLEILVVVGIIALITVVSSQAIYSGLLGNKKSSERSMALSLAQETFEAVRAISSERWQSVYTDLVHGTTAYYPSQSSGKWVVSSGVESVVLDSLTFSRSFTVQNVCRNVTARDILAVTTGPPAGQGATCASGLEDPSTQKVTVTISWNGGDDSVSWSEYMTRSHNKVCLQTSWSTSGDPGSPVTCPSPTSGATGNYNALNSVTTGGGGASFCISGGGC